MLKSIIIDDREPAEIRRLDFGSTPKCVSRLDYGDFWVVCEDAATLIIERKRPDDFIQSMISHRLIEQVRGIVSYRERYGWWPYVLITGDISLAPGGMIYAGNKEYKMTYNSFQGELLSIQELGADIYHCQGDWDIPNAFMRLDKRDRRKINLLPPRRVGAAMIPPEIFLASLPGIGSLNVKEILKTCRTPAKALEMITSGRSVPQVGPVTEQKIRAILGLNDNQILKIEEKENGKHSSNNNSQA